MARERKRPMTGGQAIARGVSGRVRPAPGSTADHIRVLEDRYGREGARERLGVSERTMRRYRAGGEPSKVNAERIRRQASLGRRREARLRNRGAYVRMAGNFGGGTPGARRKNTRHRTIGDRGETSIYLSGEQMGLIVDAWERGEDREALEALRDAVRDEYGWPSFEFEDLTMLQFLRDDPNA